MCTEQGEDEVLPWERAHSERLSPRMQAKAEEKSADILEQPLVRMYPGLLPGHGVTCSKIMSDLSEIMHHTTAQP